MNIRGTQINNPLQNLRISQPRVEIDTKNEQSISQKLSSSDSYYPDFSHLSDMKEGDTGSLTSWSEEQIVEFHQQDTETILANIDFTDTTKEQLYHTVNALGHRGYIDRDAAAALTFNLGMDQNLIGEERFNALEYFDKSVKGMSALSGNTQVVAQFSKGTNLIHALHDTQNTGAQTLTVRDTV